MSLIYNRVYKVPAWVTVDLDKSTATPIIDAFKELGAHTVFWMANTFPVTISLLGSRGWGHEVNKTMPFFANQDFLNFAVAHHIKGLGLNKNLTGQSANVMSSINRRVESTDDYARIFNDLLISESDIALSRLLSIGELCYGEREKVKVFISINDVPKNILQRLSDRVITIGGEGSDLLLPQQITQDSVDDIVSQVASILGYKK